jgi:hypothetical protein
MRRRAALRAGAVGLATFAGLSGAGHFASDHAGLAEGHPGPYRPYDSLAVPGAREAVVSPDGDTAYLATNSGYAAVDVSTPDRLELLADVRSPLADREDGPLRMIHDVKLDSAGDRLLVVGPANPLPEAVSGALLVDVSDPANPTELGFHETDYPVHNCDLVGDYAYLTANTGERNPLVVLDVAADPPTEVARWSLASYDAGWDLVPAGVRPIHDVVVRDDRAYLAHWDAGTWVLDVSDPTAPTHVTHFGEREQSALRDVPDSAVRRQATEPPGNAHYVAPNEDGTLVGVGRESWAFDAESDGGPSGIDLWDLSDPSEPVRRSTIDPPETPDATFGGIWTTAHNFELRGGVLYSAWYQGGVKRHDVSDPGAPVELTWWRDPKRTRFWTARPTVAGEAFVASSMGVGDEGQPGLWTFPDHAGQQADPPGILGDGGTTPITASPTENGSGGSSSSAGSGSSSEEGASNPTGTGAGGATETTAPGFGVGAGALGLGLGAWWLRRRRSRERSH